MAKKKKKGLQVVGNIDFKDDKNGLKVVGKVDFDDNNNITNKTAFIQQQDIAPVKQTGFFNDAKGSTLQKIGNTAVDATGNILKGGLSSLEGLADFGRYRGADVLDFFGADKKAKKVRETAKANTTEEIFSSINHILSGDLAGKVNENDLAAFKDIKEGSYLGDKGSQVFQGVGNSATNAALSALGGNVGGMTSLFMSAAGNAQSEAYQEGATDFQAGIYGALSGSVEAATEMMFGGLGKITQNLGFGTGALDDQLINRFTRKLSNTIAKNAVDLGLRSAGEGVEEVVAGFGNAILQKLIYMQDEDFSKLLKDQKLMDSFVSGALSSALMQAPTTLNATMQGRESSTGFTENEREVYNRELENRLKAEEKLTKRRRTQIEEQLNQDFERGYVNAQNIRDILGDKIDLQKDTRLAESFNEETRRTQAYENDVSKYDEKQAKVIQTAIDSGLLNNSNKTHDMVDLIAKLSADKGVDFDFTNNERIKDSGFAIDGRQVNGFVKDGTVNLNLESNQVLNKTVGHEITHVLEGTELYDNLQQSLKAYIGEKEWNNRISQLEKVYQNVKGANIQNELTSDLVGEHIFNDENFIRNLSTKNPNLFQKIFDEIKYMVKIATAGSKEARDLEKVKRAFEKAYRETSKIQEGTQYQLENQDEKIITTKNGERIEYNNYYEYAKDITKNNDELAKELLFKHYSQNFDVPANSNETKFYHGTDATFDYDGLKVMDFDEQTMDRNYGDYFYITTDKDFSHTYGSQIAEFIIPNDKILSLEDYRQNYSNKTDDELFNDYWALEMPDNEYIVKDIKPIIDYSKQRANDYINQQESNTKYSLTDNQGRELSKEQQEYFKDSKVRDENGSLIPLYHGSNSEFTIFDITKSGESSKEAKVGFWFTPNKKGAENFANEVWYGDKTPTTYEVYLNIKNPKVYETYEVDQQQRDSMIQNRKNIEQEIRESSHKYSWTETGDYKVTSLYNDLVEMNRREKNGIRFKEDAQYNEDFYRRLAEERNISNEKFNEMNQDAKNQVELETQKRKADDEFYSYVNSDAYEQFKTDLYLSAGMRAEDANVGGMGMMMKNENEAVANFVEGLKQQGYDGIIIKNTHYDNESLGEGKNNDQYVAFYPNQIKNVDNTNPTSNPDIRYSLSVQEANTGTDSEGRTLTNNQMEYFKESRITDENGNLKVIYHGTPNDFTVFDTKNFGGANGTAEGFGIYLTDNIEVADDYLQQDKGKVMELYANITKPATTTELTTTKQDIVKAIKELTLKDAQEMVNDGDYDNINDALKDTWISNYTYTYDKTLEQAYNDVANTILEGSENDFEVLQELMNGSGNNDYSSVEDFYKVITDTLGFDGIQTKWDFKDNDLKQKNANIYIAFNSNQVKNIDNLNPTDDADIRYQLGNNEVAPTSGWNVRSEDVRLQSAFKDTIAPLQEQVQELSNTINELKENIPQREYRPLTEQEGEQLAEEYANRDISNEIAPVSENLTEEENQRLAVLDLLERNNMLDEEHQYERDQLLEKANPTIPNEEATPGKALEDIRDENEVGKRSVKAYQYEHPEVKPYFQQEARGMLSDLQNSQKGERFMFESPKQGQGTSYEVLGIKRFTSPEIADLLDSKWGYTYKDIEKGLKAIIEDHGAENIAVAKRIEFILDDNLRNGYTDWQTGMEIPPNQDYLNMLAEQEWNEYYDNIQEQYPLEPYTPVEENVPDYYSIEDEDVSDMKIDKDLQDMTVDDINLEPFLEGLVKADERQKARQEIAKEIGNRKEYTPKKKGLIGKAIDLYKSLTNEFAVVDKFAKDVKNPTITHKIDTWNNYVPLAQTNITTAQTDINGKAIGRSVDSIWNEADDLGVKEILDEYLKHWSNVDRGKRGKGALDYSAKESYKRVQEIKEQHPEVHRLAKDCWQLYRNARHNLRDAGTISQQQSDAIGRANPHYNPFISENLDAYFTETGELKPRKTIKSAKGGAELEGLLSSEEAMKKYMYSQFDEATGNRAFLEIVKSSPNQFVLGGDDRTSYVNQDHLSVDKDGYYLTAYENGEPITARISKEMYDSLSRQTKHRVDEFINKYESILKPIEKFGNLRRKMLTELSPSFLLKNPGKDFQEAVINSKYTKDMIANYMNPETWIELANGTGEADIFTNNYGSGLVMGQYDIDISKIDPKSKNFNFLKKLGKANEYMELITRYAEFKASRQNGASIEEAMYNAREVTTNFSRGNPVVKAFNKYGMTFLNSSIQGFDKFIRNFSGENGAKGVVNSLAKAVIFGIAPAVFNELAFGSGDDKDEEYEAIPDYIKDNYYIIKTGDGNFIRIPKGRVFSVFGSAARRTIEMMEGEENAFDGFLENAQQQIGINNPEENNIFAPFIQAMGGRKLDSGQTAGSAWYGGDIIPSRLQKERPEDQYDASIDKFSIWLGQQTGISPYKINYVLDQYSGGIGDLILPMITDEANSDGSIIAPIKDQFTADSTTDNKYVSEFYDTKGKLYTGSKATDEDKLKNMYMNHISMEMSQLYAERREVQASDLPKKEKYAKSQEIKKEINRLAKIGLDGYNNLEVTGNYAVINDDMGYYKNANGEWKPIPQNDITYTESEGLTDKEKSAYYGLKNDIYKIGKEYEDESLNASEEEKRILNAQKKNEIIDTIKSSNLDDNTKAYIYSKKYGDKKIQSFVNSGIDVNSYLDYKQQDFSADKDRNGKSISGSKKRKVFDYINSMNIPYEQKLILAKSEYNSFNQNNYDIINYIENSGMSYDERIELYKNLGFKVDGDSISW